MAREELHRTSELTDGLLVMQGHRYRLLRPVRLIF
jgi:hypothetical protein